MRPRTLQTHALQTHRSYISILLQFIQARLRLLDMVTTAYLHRNFVSFILNSKRKRQITRIQSLCLPFHRSLNFTLVCKTHITLSVVPGVCCSNRQFKVLVERNVCVKQQLLCHFLRRFTFMTVQIFPTGQALFKLFPTYMRKRHNTPFRGGNVHTTFRLILFHGESNVYVIAGA